AGGIEDDGLRLAAGGDRGGRAERAVGADGEVAHGAVAIGHIGVRGDGLGRQGATDGREGGRGRLARQRRRRVGGERATRADEVLPDGVVAGVGDPGAVRGAVDEEGGGAGARGRGRGGGRGERAVVAD